jgi:beta-phosphoglucomutase-like phosphatase (HAD superfamily)
MLLLLLLLLRPVPGSAAAVTAMAAQEAVASSRRHQKHIQIGAAPGSCSYCRMLLQQTAAACCLTGQLVAHKPSPDFFLQQLAAYHGVMCQQ